MRSNGPIPDGPRQKLECLFVSTPIPCASVLDYQLLEEASERFDGAKRRWDLRMQGSKGLGQRPTIPFAFSGFD